MSAQPWHRRFHSDALAGMLSLTLEERGAYQTVLDLIYDRGGPIADNERLLAGYMNVSIRKWRVLRESLIAKGKIISADGLLSNLRAEKEIENGVKTARKLAENGAKGGRKKAENSKKDNENSETDLAPLKPRSSLPQATTTVPLSNDNGHGLDDPDKAFWASAKGYLGQSNGGLINKLCAEYGRDAVSTAIMTAMLTSPQPPDRKAWVIGILKRGKSVSAGEIW